jgi:hypothetical protein
MLKVNVIFLDPFRCFKELETDVSRGLLALSQEPYASQISGGDKPPFHLVYTSPMPRYFTLPEANETLVTIRPLMDEVQAIREKILASQPEAWPAIEKSAGNGGNRALSNMVQDFEKLDALIHRILETGALIKDINMGLLDFPAMRDEHEVYLCWKYGEGEIAFWHEIEAGYAGRQPIEDL